jgi:hypothetical protein
LAGKSKKEWQARTTTEEGRHPEAALKRTRSIPNVPASPGEKRSAVSPEIASASAARVKNWQHGNHEEGFVEGCSGTDTPFGLE